MRSFAVTWDYRCPFARNAHEHVVLGMASGNWDVRFVGFSLDQVHVAEGEPDVWDNPAKARSLLAMQVGVVVRDRYPERFPDLHLALFAARHDRGLDFRDDEVVDAVLAEQRLDAEAVRKELADGWPLEQLRREHEQAATDHRVWGVPTFIAGGQAVFVRLMHRPDGDAGLARDTIERLLDLVTGWPELNEFKHTSISR